MIAFLALLFVILVIYQLTKTKEGFNPMNTSPEHRINIPVNKIPSMLASPPASATGVPVENTVSEPASNGSIFPGCDVKPSTWPGMLPGSLPTSPYEQIAVGSPLPYQDTTLIKANRQQLINMLEMLKGFLAFEAQELSERSDPTIQLPLQTARTDFHVLQMEVDVLNRNPGIQPTITLSHLNEISSNLAFLQREVRLIGSAGPIQGPIYEFTKPVEGFQDAPPRKAAGAAPGGMSGGKSKSMTDTIAKVTSEIAKPATKKAEAEHAAPTATSAAVAKVQSGARPTATSSARETQLQVKTPEHAEVITNKQSNDVAANAAKKKEAAAKLLSNVVPANQPAGPSDVVKSSTQSGPAPFNNDIPSDKRASVKDLQDFIIRINCESVRLSASGTSDPIIQSRVVALADIKSNIEDILKNVEMDPKAEANIPISKADLEKALPSLGKPNDPLPQLVKSAELPAGLANLLPSNMQNDPKVTKEIGSLIDKYFNTLINGISFSVKYTSPREAQAGGGMSEKGVIQIGNSAHAGQSEQFVNAFAERKHKSASTIDKTGFPSLADLDNATNAKFSPMDSGLLITDPYAPLPSDAGRGPSHFDWKSRAKEIEGQVKKRGLNPADFGIMPAKAKISNDFSWKGYARMICTRLQATMDPNLPVACGCPPMDWSGWRNAK
jgi:hypothetical protein